MFIVSNVCDVLLQLNSGLALHSAVYRARTPIMAVQNLQTKLFKNSAIVTVMRYLEIEATREL